MLELLSFQEAFLGRFSAFAGAPRWVEGLPPRAGPPAHALARVLIELPVGPTRAGEKFVFTDTLARVSV